MLFPVKTLLQNRQPPLTVSQDIPLKDAMALMIEHDYSQLPVVNSEGVLLGLVSEQTILRKLFHLQGDSKMLSWPVNNFQVSASIVNENNDLLKILEKFKSASVIIAVDKKNKPIGILNYQDFFQSTSEGMLLVQAIEEKLQEHSKQAFSSSEALTKALTASFGANKDNQPNKDFDELSLGEMLQFITHKDNWPKFNGIFEPKSLFVRHTDEAREIRNQIAHFKGNLQSIQRNSLLETLNWLSNRVLIKPNQILPTAIQSSQKLVKVVPDIKLQASPKPVATPKIPSPKVVAPAKEIQSPPKTVATSELPVPNYLLLRQWLQKQIATSITAEFVHIKEIVGKPLPAMAYNQQGWWGNDKNQPQSQAWLTAGWQVLKVSMTARTVTFQRQSVTKALGQVESTTKKDIQTNFIADDVFLKPLVRQTLAELKKKYPVLIKSANHLPERGFEFNSGAVGIKYVWTFNEKRTVGIELYINSDDQARNKSIFAKFEQNKTEIEKGIGSKLRWQSLPNDQSSRIRTERQTTDSALTRINEHIKTLVETTLKFVTTFEEFIKQFKM